MNTKLQSLATLNRVGDIAPAVILAGGALNGIAVLFAQTWINTGAPSLFLGASPFDIVVIAIATWLIVSNVGEIPKPTIWAECISLVLIWVPSSAISWVAVAFYSIVLAMRSTGRPRAGALLFLALALSSLWASVGIRWFEVAITSAEANVVGAILALVYENVVVTTNAIGIADGFKVILLPACTTAQLLPKALLAVVAIAALFGSESSRRLVLILLTVTAVIALGNWARLAFMATSAESYAFMHGSVGANIIDTFQTLVVLAAGAILTTDD